MSDLEELLLAQIHEAGLPEPEREYLFMPGRRYRFDFAWPADMIAAECEGGTWNQGRHTRGSGYGEDCRKYNAATVLDWRVFRFTREMIESGEAISLLGRQNLR